MNELNYRKINIFKYRSGSKRDIRLLAKNQFYSASSDSLNDILETKVVVDEKGFQLLSKYLNNVNIEKDNSSLNILNNFRKETKKWGVYSLSQIYNDELMWAYYANSHKGFCIEYDFDIFKQYQLNNEFSCEVKYQNDLPVVAIDDMNDKKKLIRKLIGTKSNNWKHEKEIRFITGTNGIFHYYNNAVKSIYFGYHSSKRLRKLIMRVLRGRGITYYEIHPENNLYKLKREKVLDIYKNYIIPNKNNVQRFIPEYDEQIKPHKILIEKAIDIFLKEKISEKILDVYISRDKGTKKNPVFFITYKDKHRGMTVNYWISKEEILKEDNKLNQ
mgnify:CR=1 FL=1